MARPKPEPQICGEPAEDGQFCNLPKGHDPKVLHHTYIAPKRVEDPVVDPDKTEELRSEVDELHAATPPDPAGEDLAAAAARIFDDDLVKRPVIAKLARIMASLPTILPEGRNAHFGYGFIKDTQISGALRPRMAKEGLMVIPNVLEESWVETKTSKGGTSWVTKLKVEFTVIDADSGDSVTGTGTGYGDDAGDKGANKAFTAAMKYWLMKLFQIGGEDNEDDARADVRAAGREAGSDPNVAGVVVEGSNITGIARGGRSDKITATQKKQVFALYKDLGLTIEGFVDRVDTLLGDKLVLPEDETQHQATLNGYLNNLDADDAGKLLAGLIDEKDAREVGPAGAPGDREENAPEPMDEPSGAPYG